MKKKVFTKAVAALAAVFCLAACLSGCGSEPPELESVRDEFAALITASAEVNEIFFGEGLPVYPRLDSNDDKEVKYDEATGIYYWFITDGEYREVIKYYDPDAKKNVYLAREADYTASGKTGAAQTVFRLGGEEISCRVLEGYTEPDTGFVYDEDAPLHYDYVKVESPFQTPESIKELAERVYTANYLESLYVMRFDGYRTDDSIIFARYVLSDDGRFMKYNLFTPYFEKQTTYDLSSMKIISPSRADSVNVEITAYGTYIDYEKLEKATGEFKRVLKFVKTDAGWRLDTPTY